MERDLRRGDSESVGDGDGGGGVIDFDIELDIDAVNVGEHFRPEYREADCVELDRVIAAAAAAGDSSCE